MRLTTAAYTRPFLPHTPTKIFRQFFSAKGSMVRKSESHRTEDVLMLFRCTENPPENLIFLSAALRVSVVMFSYTENSSFPYMAKHGENRGQHMTFVGRHVNDS